jgi:hypothetical protein
MNRYLQAILDHDPKMRPTATGILHFLKGTCRLGNKDLEKNFMEKLLPSLSFSQLIGHLEMRQAPRDLIKVVEEMVEQRRVYAFNWDPKLKDWTPASQRSAPWTLASGWVCGHWYL